MKPAGPRSLLSLALAALLGAASVHVPVQAADSSAYGYANAGRSIQLGIGKSYVVDLPVNAAEVLVADPKIANAVVRSARKAYVIGVAIGETDIIFFDRDGQQIENLAVSVARDLSPIRNNIRASMPDAMVSARAVGESVMLTGSVRSPADAQAAADIAANLVGDPNKVVNNIAVEGRDQVMLKVSVVEMQRNVAKQLGVDWNINGDVGGTGVGFATSNGLSDLNPLVRVFNGSSGCMYQDKIGESIQNIYNPSEYTPLSGCSLVDAKVKAAEENGLLRTLAEPTLLAISGEKAEFLAGGEFPVPVPSDDGIGIEYKKYGVSLMFTPVVLSSGRISIQIGTEVSEPSSQGVTIQGTTVNGLTVRRATTTVELPSGGSLAMAGLLQDNSRQAFTGLPGLINLPVLGSLFRSRDYQRGQTELVVIVTPYIAKSNPRQKLALPDDGFSTPDDAESVLLGRLNKIYAPGLKTKPGAYRGPIGHIVE